jgi:hypothetical protein
VLAPECYLRLTNLCTVHTWHFTHILAFATAEKVEKAEIKPDSFYATYLHTWLIEVGLLWVILAQSKRVLRRPPMLGHGSTGLGQDAVAPAHVAMRECWPRPELEKVRPIGITNLGPGWALHADRTTQCRPRLANVDREDQIHPRGTAVGHGGAGVSRD